MVLALDTIQVKVVGGAVAVCAWCQKVRDEGQKWHVVDGNLLSQAGLDMTHTICPECKNALWSSQ